MKKINYNKRMYEKEIKLEDSNGNQTYFSIELLDFDSKPDCKVGNFGYNFYFRTPAGLQGKKYTTTKKMELAIEKVAKKYGFRVIQWTKEV